MPVGDGSAMSSTASTRSTLSVQRLTNPVSRNLFLFTSIQNGRGWGFPDPSRHSLALSLERSEPCGPEYLLCYGYLSFQQLTTIKSPNSFALIMIQQCPGGTPSPSSSLATRLPAIIWAGHSFTPTLLGSCATKSFPCHRSEKSAHNSFGCHTSKIAVCKSFACHTSEPPWGPPWVLCLTPS